MESDGSANRPRVPPAVHYPRSSAGPNELISSSRADTETKREERERKKTRLESAVEEWLADPRFSGCVTISQRVRGGVM